jgi:hypothetical protein
MLLDVTPYSLVEVNLHRITRRYSHRVTFLKEMKKERERGLQNVRSVRKIVPRAPSPGDGACLSLLLQQLCTYSTDPSVAPVLRGVALCASVAVIVDKAVLPCVALPLDGAVPTSPRNRTHWPG